MRNHFLVETHYHTFSRPSLCFRVIREERFRHHHAYILFSGSFIFDAVIQAEDFQRSLPLGLMGEVRQCNRKIPFFVGTNIYEFNIDSLEEKPWRKPGADITDYFNYGFTEDTWKVYCDRQRRLRGDNNSSQGVKVTSWIRLLNTHSLVSLCPLCARIG